MKPTLQKIWKVVKNKYVIATIVFLVVIFFLDENNLLVTFSLKRDVDRLKAEERSLVEGIATDSVQTQALKYDRKAIERYGRENYYMKCANEDIYIIKR